MGTEAHVGTEAHAGTEACVGTEAWAWWRRSLGTPPSALSPSLYFTAASQGSISTRVDKALKAMRWSSSVTVVQQSDNTETLYFSADLEIAVKVTQF